MKLKKKAIIEIVFVLIVIAAIYGYIFTRMEETDEFSKKYEQQQALENKSP